MLMRELRVGVMLMLLLRGLLVDAGLLTLELAAQDDGLLLHKVLVLLQEAQVVDVLCVAAGFLLHGRDRRGRVGISRVNELRTGKGPSARAGPRQGFEIRVDFHQMWLLRCFRHGRQKELAEESHCHVRATNRQKSQVGRRS